MEAQVRIRQVQPDDWSAIVQLEQENFSSEEAASPQALQERIERIADTFLVAELQGQLAAYIVGPAVASRHLTDDLFVKVTANPWQGGFIAVQSLSVSPDWQGQGLGTLLLAAFKEIAVQQNRQGISLTCHEELVSYYEMNGFADEGLSDSAHGGAVWYDMVWDNPAYKEDLC